MRRVCYLHAMIDKNFYKLKEVANIFSVNPASVRNWINQGKLKAVLTPGGHRRIRRSALLDLLEKYPVTSSDESFKSLEN